MAAKKPAARRTARSTGLKANGAYRVKAVNQIPLFGTLLSLAVLLGLISLMWYREGR